MKSARARAEEFFAATQKKDNQPLMEKKEKAAQEMADRVAKLKALRLAKEAADKEADKEKEDDG